MTILSVISAVSATHQKVGLAALFLLPSIHLYCWVHKADVTADALMISPRSNSASETACAWSGQDVSCCHLVFTQKEVFDLVPPANPPDIDPFAGRALDRLLDQRR